MLTHSTPQRVHSHSSILKIGLRIPLLGMDEYGELGRIPEEKDWGVIEHPIVVPLLGIKLDRKSPRISCRVGRSFFSTDRREPREAPCLLADAVEHVHRCEVADIIGYLELAECTGALGVDDTVTISSISHSPEVAHWGQTAPVSSRDQNVPTSR